MKIICIIPARGGSKRIKNKNIIKINSIPLINFVINKVYKSTLISNFYVFSNNQKIKQNVKKLYKFKKLSILSRSKDSEKDTASTETLLDEINSKLDFEIAILLQITNPFINHKIIDSALKKFIKMKYDSLLSVVPMKSFIWEKKGSYIRAKNYRIFDRPRSQEINKYYLENGSFYIFKKSNYLKNRNRLGGKIGYFAMEKESIFELDDLSDLKLIKKLIK